MKMKPIVQSVINLAENRGDSSGAAEGEVTMYLWQTLTP